MSDKTWFILTKAVISLIQAAYFHCSMGVCEPKRILYAKNTPLKTKGLEMATQKSERDDQAPKGGLRADIRNHAANTPLDKKPLGTPRF